MRYTPDMTGAIGISDFTALRERLVAAVCPDGGWGYAPGQPAHPEPTCLALLALSAEPDRFAAALAAGLQSLQRNATADGSYRLARGRPEAAWPTALALFTRAALGRSDLDKTIARLKAMRGR